MPHAGWSYEGIISFGSGTSGTNKQVLVRLEDGWGSLFYYSQCKSAGEDIRFYDGSTQCRYFIEEWNTSGYTYVWVEVPSSSATQITMEWGNSSASNEAESWSGVMHLIATSNTITGWTRNTSYDGRFLLAGSSVGTGGVSTHTHGAGTLSTSNYSNSTSYRTTLGTNSTTWYGASTHVHTVGTTASASHEPPYRNYPLQYYTSGKIPPTFPGALCVFGPSSIADSNYQAYTPFGDNLFVRLGSAGTTGGVTQHTHTGYNTGSVTFTAYKAYSFNRSNISTTHYHTMTVQYETLTFPNIRCGIYQIVNSNVPIKSGIVAMFTEVPPLGWTRKSGWDGYYLQGGGTYETTTAASNLNHSHTVSSTTGTASSGTTQYYESSGTASYYAVDSHTHTVSGSMASSGDLNLLYYTYLIASRNTSDVTITGITAGGGTVERATVVWM